MEAGAVGGGGVSPSLQGQVFKSAAVVCWRSLARGFLVETWPGCWEKITNFQAYECSMQLLFVNLRENQ